MDIADTFCCWPSWPRNIWSHSIKVKRVPWSWYAWSQKCTPLGQIEVWCWNSLAMMCFFEIVAIFGCWLFFRRCWLKVAKSFYPAEEIEEFCLDALEEEIMTLENELSEEDQRIGFCHNDLQYGNIMIDEETRVVTIIVSCSINNTYNLTQLKLQH